MSSNKILRNVFSYGTIELKKPCAKRTYFLFIFFVSGVLGQTKNSFLSAILKFLYSQGYLLYSSAHPSHVKNSIPISQFLRLRRLCSDDSDFSEKIRSNVPVFR